MRRLPGAIKQTLLYGSSIALMKGVSLLMLPFIAHHLSPNEFGRLEVISTVAVIGSVLVGMGLDHTLFRFAGVAREPEQRKKLAAEIFSLALFIGIVAWIIGWQAAETIARSLPGNTSPYELRLVMSVLALEGCIAIPLGWLRLRNRATRFFMATTGRALTQAILVVILLRFERGVEGVLEAGLMAAVIQAMALGYLHIRDTGCRFSRNTGVQALVYSLPLIGSGLVAFALNGLDRWVLAEYASLADVAQFGVAAKFALAVVLLLQPFGMWWTPRRFEVLNSPGGQQQVANYVALGITLALIIAVLVGLSAPFLIDYLMPASYAMSSQYVVALVLVMLFKEMAELVNLGCFAGRTTGMQFVINTIGAGVGITGMFWLAPVYGVWGVIFALLLAQAIRLMLFFIISQQLLPLPYPTRSLLLLTGTGIGWLVLGTQTTTSVQQVLAVMTGTLSLLIIALLLKLVPVPATMASKLANR